jgi:hypothetical protein
MASSIASCARQILRSSRLPPTGDSRTRLARATMWMLLPYRYRLSALTRLGTFTDRAPCLASADSRVMILGRLVWLTIALHPRRFTIAPSAVGCKRLLDRVACRRA